MTIEWVEENRTHYPRLAMAEFGSYPVRRWLQERLAGLLILRGLEGEVLVAEERGEVLGVAFLRPTRLEFGARTVSARRLVELGILVTNANELQERVMDALFDRVLRDRSSLVVCSPADSTWLGIFCNFCGLEPITEGSETFARSMAHA